jgi:hypothetical protein
MSFVVGIFLLLGLREEECFWAFVSLVKGRGLGGLYANDLPLLRSLLYQLDRLIEIRMPKLFSHFKENGTQLFVFFFFFFFFFCFGSRSSNNCDMQGVTPLMFASG